MSNGRSVSKATLDNAHAIALYYEREETVMTLKEYCAANHISVRQLSQQCAIPYSTLSDLVNGKTDSDRVAFGVVCALADALRLSLDEMREMLAAPSVEQSDAALPYRVVVRNKRYYVEIDGVGREYLCKVTPLTKTCIWELASWRYDDYKKLKELEALSNVLLSNA